MSGSTTTAEAAILEAVDRAWEQGVEPLEVGDFPVGYEGVIGGLVHARVLTSFGVSDGLPLGGRMQFFYYRPKTWERGPLGRWVRL